VSDTVRQISKAIAEFQSGRDAKKLHLVFETLRTSTLRPKHFEKAKASMLAFKAAMKEVLYSDCTDTGGLINKRRLASSLVTISNFPDNARLLAPVSFRIWMAQKSASICIRNFPLLIDSNHTEFRHIQRTPDALTYSGDDFKFAAEFSLPLSLALDSHLPPEQCSSLPCFIPHSGGGFVATALRVNHPVMNASQYIHPAKPQDHYKGGMPGEALVPPLHIFIGTSISFANFFEEQSALYNTLRPFREDVRLRSALRKGIDIFSAGPAYKSVVPQTALDEWNGMFARLKEIVASPVWQREVAQAQKKPKMLELT
jgi:hypothetical protein